MNPTEDDEPVNKLSAAAFRSELTGPVDLNRLVALKQRWRASMAALAVRLADDHGIDHGASVAGMSADELRHLLDAAPTSRVSPTAAL